MAFKMSDEDYRTRTRDILSFERQLCDDGYVLVKFFLHITRKEQRKRFQRLEDKKATGWRVTKEDWKQNDNYEEYYDVFDEMLDNTDQPGARWTLIDAEDEDFVTTKAYETLIAALEKALERKAADTDAPVPESARATIPAFARVPIQHLSQVDLSPKLEKDEYREALDECQERLSFLHNKLYQKKIPVVLAYEGWDAAGKGGNIKRLAHSLDPRGYEVIPIAAPSAVEKEHPFLWRFWMNLPKDGHIAVFDRTWYGRVMVERIEGFCREDQWRRAYEEINQFERQLYDWGAVVRKFWLQIDKDEQLTRFQERQNTPEKQYKITPEDWRNREKWDAYELAVDEMLQRTNTAWAPWVIVESNDKYYARIKVLREVIAAIEERL
jgi:polyphosphate:AMP phosphotransferase